MKLSDGTLESAIDLNVLGNILQAGVVELLCTRSSPAKGHKQPGELQVHGSRSRRHSRDHRLVGRAVIANKTLCLVGCTQECRDRYSAGPRPVEDRQM